MRNSLWEGVPYVLEADRLGSLALEGEIIKGSDESQSQLLFSRASPQGAE